MDINKVTINSTAKAVIWWKTGYLRKHTKDAYIKQPYHCVFLFYFCFLAHKKSTDSRNHFEIRVGKKCPSFQRSTEQDFKLLKDFKESKGNNFPSVERICFRCGWHRSSLQYLNLSFPNHALVMKVKINKLINNKIRFGNKNILKWWDSIYPGEGSRRTIGKVISALLP